jgi:hypothetical protein
MNAIAHQGTKTEIVMAAIEKGIGIETVTKAAGDATTGVNPREIGTVVVLENSMIIRGGHLAMKMTGVETTGVHARMNMDIGLLVAGAPHVKMAMHNFVEEVAAENPGGMA